MRPSAKPRTALFLALTLLAGARPASAVVSAPVLKWANGGCFSSWCQTGWYSSPAVADLDGDGLPDVVWGSYDVVALNGATGTLKWRGANGSRVWPGIAIADLTGNGTLEVIVGRSSDQVTVYDRLGNVVWTRNPFGFGEVRTLAVTDLENDGQLEIIAGRAGNGDTLQLNVFEPGGTVRAGWPARHNGEPGYGWGMYNENVAVADMDGDGYKEVFGPTDTHYITALDRNGNQLPVNSRYTGRQFWSQVGVHVSDAVDVRGYADCGTDHRPNFADSAPVIADVNGDGVPELIVVGNVYNCGTNPYTDLYHMPFIFKLDRTRWSGSGFDWTAIPPDPGPSGRPLSEDYNVIENAVPNAVVADLDGDGFMEILYASYDGKVHAYWLDETQHGSWPYTIPTTGGADNFRFASEPVVADLDNDGHAEVIFTTWPKKGIPNARGQLIILNYLGQELHRVDLPPALGGGYNGGLGAPTLANIDSDPELEVVVGTIGSGVVAYDLPNTANARVLWGTGRGSYRRTGALTQPSISIGDAAVVEGNTGTTPAVFMVSLSAASGEIVSVNYATADGSAIAGIDYVATAGTVTFPPGTTSRPVSVPVIGDFAFEPDQTFFVNLSNPVNGRIARGQGVGTIIDDDTIPTDLSITKTDGRTTASPGQALTYALVATNAGPNAVVGATVTDVFPASLTGVAWTCVSAGGGACPGSGSGNINHSVNLPIGATVTYNVTATVTANPQSLSNTATITPPAGTGDTNPANNSATDTDVLICASEVPIVPDGRVGTGTIGAGATAWYAASLHLGGSYSVEFKNAIGPGPAPGALTVFKGDDGCLPGTSLTTRDTTTIDPATGSSSTARVSFTATGSDRFYRMRLVNSAASAASFVMSVAETTLFSPAWSTNGNFETYYSFQNTTGATLNGSLRLLDPAGVTMATMPVVVPPGATAGLNTATMGMTRNRVGTARFTHDGPPGAFIAEAAIANFALSRPYIQPVKFAAVREAR